MHIIRPITLQELDTFEAFAHKAGIGMASMPRDRGMLREKIENSLSSFEKEIKTPVNEVYLFVLEDPSTKEIGGVCAIYSKSGVDSPHYFFKVDTLHKPRTPLPTPTEIRILRTMVYQNGPSEIGSIFMDPTFRKGGLGRLLSLSRFLFMATFPQRFDTTVIARMRGYFEKNDVSPFYEYVTRHFIQFNRETWRTIVEHESYIPTILPDYPIYINLLPEEAQDMIGKVHPETEPALGMLKQEGFLNTPEVDLFDAGPKITCTCAHVRAIKESCAIPVAAVQDNPPESQRWLISNQKVDFRACIGTISINAQGAAIVPTDVAYALNVKPGDSIRYVSLFPKASQEHQFPPQKFTTEITENTERRI